jgi:hypothetical protein
MAGWVNRPVTTVVGTLVAVLVIGLDVRLLLGLLG